MFDSRRRSCVYLDGDVMIKIELTSGAIASGNAYDIYEYDYGGSVARLRGTISKVSGHDIWYIRIYSSAKEGMKLEGPFISINTAKAYALMVVT
jgi:hypothetical protein